MDSLRSMIVWIVVKTNGIILGIKWDVVWDRLNVELNCNIDEYILVDGWWRKCIKTWHDLKWVVKRNKAKCCSYVWNSQTRRWVYTDRIGNQRLLLRVLRGCFNQIRKEVDPLQLDLQNTRKVLRYIASFNRLSGPTKIVSDELFMLKVIGRWR